MADRKIHFGEHLGEAAWQEVPGEHRANLRASSSRRATPSPRRSSSSATSASPARRSYDLRNLFQVNVEEGRHLWAMVYLRLLRPRRPRGGGGAARAALGRRRQPAHPRRLQREDAGLAVVLHVHVFTDRDGKFQLRAGESGFDPLPAPTKFMLTEEAHHMFVGESGVARHPAHREVMNQLQDRRPGEAARAGVIDLPTIQRYLNFLFR